MSFGLHFLELKIFQFLVAKTQLFSRLQFLSGNFDQMRIFRCSFSSVKKLFNT